MRMTATGKYLMSEHEIQSSFFDWIELHKGKHNLLNYFFAIPNGAYKSGSARMKFQREGLRPGVPDVFCPVPSAEYLGLWFEFKAAGGRTSLNQDIWIKNLRAIGQRVEIITDWTAAANITIEYLGLEIKRFE